MSKTLILIDIDRTIINEKAEITDPTLATKIAQMVEQGWEIGLCSDRPTDELEYFARFLPVNGPLVGEMGAVIEFPELQNSLESTHMLLSTRISLGFLDIRNKFIVRLIDISREDYLHITLGRNSIEHERRILADHQQGIRYIYVDIAREHSFAMSMRVFGPDGPEKCGQIIEDLAEFAKRDFADQFGNNLEMESQSFSPMLYVNPEEWGCVIVHFPTNGKNKAGQALLDKYDYDRIFMIGDTSFDDLKDTERVVQLGVANAWDDYKNVCQFVAGRKYASGVIDCLAWAEQNA